MPAQPAPRRYQTSIDRVGLAIGAGGVVGGAITALMMAFAGTQSVRALFGGFLIGSVMTALSITALAAIPWALLHAAGRRGPAAAAVLGAVIGFVLFLGGQTYGYGLFAMPAMGAQALLYRWASGILSSLVMAAMAAAIAVVMWRVAYRRVS